jgi:hypothetical protein
MYNQLGYNDARNFTVYITKVYIKNAIGSINAYTTSFSATTSSLFKSGNGTSSSPYLISSSRHLDNIRYSGVWEYEYGSSNQVYNIKTHFRLVNSIFLSVNWNPIARFSGNLDGAGYLIDSMVVVIPRTKFTTSPQDFGLIGRLSNGTVKNLHLQNAYISGDYQHEGGYVNVGAVVGYNSGGTISNCSVAGEMYVHRYYSLMGGIAGFSASNGKIENCTVNMTISSYGEVGGIVGVFSSGVVDKCVFKGAIFWNYANKDDFGYNNAGGIVGRAVSGAILNCKNYGNIKYDGNNTDSRTLKPCISEIVGYAGSNVSLNNNSRIGYVNIGLLRVITWKTGVWPFQTTHTHDQSQYVSSSEVGYLAS